MTPEREAAVIAAAQAGDQRARDELVAGYLPLVYNIVGRALHGHADVDDVVQETMLRVLHSLAGLRDPHRFRSWLVAVTVNQIRRHWHTRQASVSEASVDEMADLADPGADFVDLTIIRLGLAGQRREVAEATRWLGEDDRALLALWWLEASGELTRSEVATALELPPQFVAVRVQRMKAQLEAARVAVRALTAVPRCPQLDYVVAGWDGVPSALWRKRITRHTRDCAVCQGHHSDLIPAQSLLVGLALVPPTTALAWFATQAGNSAAALSQTQLGGSSGGEASGTASAPAGHAAHPLHSRGGKRPGGHRRPRVRPRGASVLAGGAAVTAAATVMSVALGSGGGSQKTTAANTARPVLVRSAPISGPPPHTPSASHRPAAPPHRTPPPAPSRPTASPSHSTATASSPPPAQPPAAPDAAAQVLAVINQARAAHGLPPYTITAGLTRSAQGHNTAMDNGCGLSHQCPGEAPLGDRETAAGVQWGAAGENIGQASAGPDAQQIASAAVDLTHAMLNEKPPNDGHRQNILSSTFTHVGIAVFRDANGTVWLTQDFSN